LGSWFLQHFFNNIIENNISQKGEQWGAPNATDPFNNPVIHRNQTAWFIEDSFGLKSAEENGKNFYESFNGGHLQFTTQDLQNWIMKYICF